MRITNDGNVGVGTATPNTKLEVYVDGNASMSIKAGHESYTSTLFLATGLDSTSAYKAAIIAQGMSTYSRSKLHFCLNGDANNTYPTYNATLSNSRMTIDYNGNVGINNTSPWAPLNIGSVDNISDGYINFSKNTGAGSYRNCRVGYNSNFGFSIGDNGNVNNNTNSWTVQFAIAYNAPFASLGANEVGRVIMQYGYGTTSDERIKTNIKTIENALDKTLLLRGVNYYDFRIEPDRLKMGLIAQEAELIIPEVVHTDDNGMKSIEYQNIVGLLIEAIKDQQKQINDLKNILIKNNLN